MDDGSALYDSHVIIEHLDSLKCADPMTHLIPESIQLRIMVKRWEVLADGISDAAASIFVEHKRPDFQQSDEWIARQ